MKLLYLWFCLISLFSLHCQTTEIQEETVQEEKASLEGEYVIVQKSHIPGAGDGAFAKKEIPEGTLIGNYIGKEISMERAKALYKNSEHHYFFGMPECANKPLTPYIDGDRNHFVSKVNFAPKKINGKYTDLINCYFKKFCEYPHVRLFSLRDIKKGEELYVSYGDGYEYDFMKYKEVQDFFLQVTGIPRNKKFTYEP